MTRLFGSPQVPSHQSRIRSGQVRASRLRSLRRPMLESLEDRVVPAVFFWNGGAGAGDTNWMTATNWAGGFAPSAGSDLVFPTGPTQLNANNNFPVGTSFDSVAITGSGYTLSGNALTLQAGLSNSGGTSSVSFPVTLAAAQGVTNSNGSLTVGSINEGSYQLTLQAGSGTLTVNGQISGTGGLVKGGAGTAVLAVANTFTGPTQVTGGTLTLQDSGALGVGDGTAGTATTLTNNATLQLQNSITISNHLLNVSTGGGTVAASGSDVWTANVTFGDPSTYSPWIVSSSFGSTLELDGVISTVGNGPLVVSGSGRTILTGTSSLSAIYSNYVYVTSGTLEVDGSLTVPNYFVDVYSGGTLSGTGTVISTYSDPNYRVHVDSNGTIDPGTATGPGTLTVGNSLRFFGTNPAVHIDVNGAGAGQYDQVKVLGDVSLNNAALSVSLGMGFTPSVGQTFTILDNDGTDSVVGTFSGLAQGGLFVVGSTVFQISYTGDTGNDVVLTAVAGKVWDGASTSTSNWNDPTNWQGGVAPVTGDNLIFPSGAARLNNTNNFSAGMSFGSILISGAGYTLGGNLAVLSSGLSAAGATTVNLPLQLSAGQGIVETAGGTLTLGGAINLNGYALTLDTGSGAIVVNSSGTLSGSGSVTKAGSGTLTLSTADTYTGPTAVTGGTLTLQNAGALGVGDGTAGTATTLTNNATLQLQNSITISNHLLNVSTGGGTVAASGSDVWTANVTFGDQSTYSPWIVSSSFGSTLELDGVISTVGNGPLVVSGSGRTILTGTSSLSASYQNYVYVTSGTLEVDGSLTVPNYLVDVYSGGTLSGTGTVISNYYDQSNRIHVDSNGTIDPGTATGPGALTLGNSLRFFGTNPAVHIDINGAGAGQYDQVKVLGDVSLNNAALSVSLTYQPTLGQTFTILDNDGTDPISGTFDGLAEGSLLQVGNVVFSISYVGGTGNDVVLTVQGYYPPTAVTATGGFSVSATEGIGSSVQTVATFTDPSPQKLLDYVATIDWGDSNTSTATIANGGIVQSGNTFYINLSHTYAEEGSYTVTTSVTHESLTSNVVTSTATVGDAPLTGTTSATATGGIAGGTAATLSGAAFTDANTGAPLSDFSVTAVNWGDGNTDTSGLTISGSGGTYAVQGTHVYTSPGNYNFSINVKDVGGKTATITGSTTVVARADLSVSASGPGSTVAGDPNGFDYTLVVTNNGPGANTGGFTLTDVLPMGLTFQTNGSTSGATAIGQTVTFTNGTGLANGGSETIVLHVTLASSAQYGNTLSNSATVVSNGTVDPNSANDVSNTVSTTVDTKADLSISASGPASAVAGDPNGFNYTVVVTNHGPSDNAGGFQMTDVLPAGLTFQTSGSTSGASAIGQTVTFTTTTGLASGSSQTITLHVTLASSAANGSVLHNSASVATGGTVDPNSTNDTSNTVSTTVQAQADLGVSNAHTPDPVIAGDTLTYTVAVTNYGPSDAQNTTLSYPLPAGTTLDALVSVPSGWTETDSVAVGSGGTLTFHTNALASGASTTFTIEAEVASSVPNGATRTSTATVHTTTAEPSPDTTHPDTAQTTANIIARADLSVTNAGPLTAIAGDPTGFDYTVTVTNDGPSDNTGGFTVTDVLPMGLTFHMAGSTPGTSPIGQTVTFTNTTGLASGASQAITIHVTLIHSAVDASVLSDTATVATNGTVDPNSANDTSNTVSTTVLTRADLAVSVSNPAYTLAGTDLTYTVTITNNGPSDAQTVSLSGLSIPANTAFISYTSAPGWSSTAAPAVGATSGSITASIGTLSAGASGTFTFKVQVNGFTPGNTPISLTATGTTSTTDPTPNDSNNAATGTSLVTLTGAGLATNLANPSQVNLVGDGNTVAFATVGSQIGVVINGTYYGAFSPNGRIVSYGRGPNDRITVSSTIALPATLYGSGSGDTLVAGGGNSVLVGGGGSATLVSGAGKNILISGGGSAGAVKTLNGTLGSNVMIGGSTDWDHNDQALGSLLAEWGRTDLPPSTSYATRVSDLLNGGGLNGSFTLNSTTVHDNGVRDVLIGGGTGQNWYLAHVSGAGVLDIIIGKKNTETVTAI